ncbi:MAG: molecular chaperone GrpE (heat shock protein), partial [Myxococcota bacterium]
EHVAQVLQPGYRFAESQTADALIRPARVIVAG